MDGSGSCGCIVVGKLDVEEWDRRTWNGGADGCGGVVHVDGWDRWLWKERKWGWLGQVDVEGRDRWMGVMGQENVEGCDRRDVEGWNMRMWRDRTCGWEGRDRRMWMDGT